MSIKSVVIQSTPRNELHPFRNELHPFRKEVSYLFEQGPNVFTTFEDDDYYQGEVSKSISYLKENESYINEKSRLEEIYVLSEKVLVKPV
ncbi:hypothetical protein RJY08_002228 [Vibrio alginolyticus]|nr:hypothetical protein [Vibrio alginolyticus]